MRRAPSHPPGGRTRRIALVLFGLALLTACGGGGGGDEPPPPVIIDGLAGTVLLPDYDLGRINEQEPNDSPAQAFRMPPVWPRCALEVAGTLESGSGWFGRADPADVLVFQCVRSQAVALELRHEETDPTAVGVPNAFRAEVYRRATGVSLGETAPGGQPHTLVFDATAGEDLEIVIRPTAGGTGWWQLRLVCSDPILVPKPVVGAATAVTASDRAARPPSAPAQGIAAEQRCAHTHVLVRMRDGCDAGAVCERHGLALGRATGLGSHRAHLDPAAVEDPEARVAALCEALADDPDVLWAEPDWVVRPCGEPGDPEFPRQWNMRAVGAPSAWDVTTGHESITIGVVDSGIGAAPDVDGQLVPGFDFVSSAAVSGDGDGRDFDPTDNGDQFTGAGTSSWHGTHIAALLAGKHDDQGIAGMAPRCRLMILRALGIGGGFVSDAADAILYAAGQFTLPDGTRLDTPLPIVNLSIGLDQDSTELREACERANNLGVLLVAAVGNGGSFVEFPARYPSTFAVAAVDGQLLTTQYSAFGDAVDIAAPGGGFGADADDDGWHDGILSAVLDETVEPARWSHAYLVGTSQAVPHVAGAAALLLSLDPTLTAADLKSILRGGALDLGVPGDDLAYGSGLLQVHESVKIVLDRIGNPRVDDPYLLLPRTTVQFDGLRSSIEVPLLNGGAGTMNIFFARCLADDGGDWLSAELSPVLSPAPPVNQSKVTIRVDRSRLLPENGRYSGTVALANSAGSHATIRVVLYVGERTRAGELLPVVALDAEEGIARRKAIAYPETGYRFWVRGLPASTYVLQAGEDLDLDGFFCEGADACGWHGGPTEADAIPVEYVPGTPAVRGLSITLRPPP